MPSIVEAQSKHTWAHRDRNLVTKICIQIQRRLDDQVIFSLPISYCISFKERVLRTRVNKVNRKPYNIQHGIYTNASRLRGE